MMKEQIIKMNEINFNRQGNSLDYKIIKFFEIIKNL